MGNVGCCTYAPKDAQNQDFANGIKKMSLGPKYKELTEE